MKLQHSTRFSGYARRIVQIISLIFFLYLFLFTRAKFQGWAYQVESPVSVNLFFRADPLLFTSVILSVKRFIVADFLPMVILLVLVVIFGRFFCGWICPFGTLLDFMPCLIPSKKQNPRQFPYHRFKYYFLLGLLLIALLGINIIGWFDPITILFRSLTYAVFPYVDYLLRGIIRLLYQVPFLLPLADKIDTDLFQPVFGTQTGVYLHSWLHLGVLIALLMLVIVQRRYWCRYLCPLGAMLGVFSRISFFRRKVTDACTQCGICTEQCRMNSIGERGEINAHQECILCLECQEVCPVDAIRFSPFLKNAKSIETPIDHGKRNLLKTLAFSLLTVPILRVISGKTEFSQNQYLLRPPGALPESEFLDQCVRCGECIKVCPENALQPALLQSNLEGMWTPVLVPRIGYCALDCTLCGKVCPTGAIRLLPTALKRHTVIGWAYIDRNRCLSWLNLECNVCEEACPLSPKAIILKEESYIDANGNEQIIRRPYVVTNRCIGCGTCENKCPLQGEAAIRVRRVPQNFVSSFGYRWRNQHRYAQQTY